MNYCVSHTGRLVGLFLNQVARLLLFYKLSYIVALLFKGVSKCPKEMMKRLGKLSLVFSSASS